jgi:hypothetical protein
MRMVDKGEVLVKLRLIKVMKQVGLKAYENQLLVKTLSNFFKGDPQALYLYNVLIKKIMYMLEYTKIKRSFYNPKGSSRIDMYK